MHISCAPLSVETAVRRMVSEPMRLSDQRLADPHFGSDGISAGLRPDAVLVLCSTTTTGAMMQSGLDGEP